MLSLSNIYKEFTNKRSLFNRSSKQYVLQNVNMEFDRSSFNLIYGKNGAGKTTILRIIAGLIKQDEGIIDLNKRELISSDVSYVSNNNRSFFLTLSAYENLKYFCSLSNSFDRKKLSHYVELFNIRYIMNKPMLALSEGERQKINIIRGILKNSEVYLFDEVSSYLDKSSINILSEIILDLKNKNKIILNVSHSTENMLVACDQIINAENFSKKNVI